MTFMVYGLYGHELMSLERLFDRRKVEKTQVIDPGHAIDPKQARHEEPRQRRQESAAEHAYRAIERLVQDRPVLVSQQIMTSPVVTLSPRTTIGEALAMFKTRRFRHMPVISAEGVLVGMVSDRDILRHLGGMNARYERRERQAQQSADLDDPVMQLMETQVLTASAATDVRYIALLFVERRIGAMPIVNDGDLVGIMTRSDILRAVMHHFVLELWS